VQEICERLFRNRKPRRIIRIFVRKVDDLKKPSVGEGGSDAREIHDAEIIGWLQEKVDAQACGIGNHADVDLRKSARFFQRLRAGPDFLFGVRIAWPLRNAGAQWFDIAMRIGNQRYGAYFLPLIGSLRRLGGKLRETPRR